jgi:hypothetical protein
MKTIDERLETAAHEVQRAVTEVPGRPGEGAVRGHRVARVARAVAAMALAVAAIGGTALLMDGDGAGDVASGASGFPTLTLDIDALGADLRLVYADDETAIAGASAECGNCEVLPSGQPSAHLVVYGDRSADAADGRIWVSFDPRGSDMFRADAFDDEPGWEPIAVPTGSAYLHEGPAAAIILWEVAPGGTVVELREMGLGSEELLSVLISVDLSSETVAVTALPAGFTELYSGPQGLINGERVVSMIWAAEPDASASVEISLWIHEGGPDGFERDLYGFAPYSEVVSAVEVRGATGVRLEGPGLTLFEWMETPDHFARLLVHGSVDPDAVLDALVEVDEATWRRMLESAEPFDESGPYNVTTTIAPSEG